MINQMLHALYKDHYRDEITNIIYCGIVDEKTYSSVYPKIVFILKEAHSKETGWCIPTGLQRNVGLGLNNRPMELDYMATWRQAGIWAYAIIHNNFDSYRVLCEPKIVAQGLQYIGMTNLKKTGGKAQADPKEIKDFAERDKDLWQKELEIMNPDLIICGGTFGIVINNLNLERDILYRGQKKKYSYSIWNINNKQSVILSFRHPNNRENHEENLNELKLLLDKLKEKGLIRSQQS
jgi:hypothetical protein